MNIEEELLAALKQLEAEAEDVDLNEFDVEELRKEFEELESKTAYVVLDVGEYEMDKMLALCETIGANYVSKGDWCSYHVFYKDVDAAIRGAKALQEQGVKVMDILAFDNMIIAE